MLTLDVMKLSDCFTPEKLANEIFRQLPELSFPIPIFLIAKACGIEAIHKLQSNISIKNLPEGLWATRETDTDLGIILYKDHDIAPYRKHFTIGHELGHHLLPLHRNSLTIDDISEVIDLKTDLRAEKIAEFVKKGKVEKKEFEKEANKFASLLLLPEHLLSAELEGKEFCLKELNPLCDITEVSFSTIVNRSCSILKDKAIALIHAENGVCNYTWSNKNALPGVLTVDKQQPLPQGSNFANHKGETYEHFTEKEPVDALTWFSDIEGGFDKIVFEQTYYQKNGFSITLVIID